MVVKQRERRTEQTENRRKVKEMEETTSLLTAQKSE